MKKIIMLFLTIVMILGMTLGIAAIEPVTIKTEIVDNTIAIDIYINLDEKIEACGVAYSFNEDILTLNQEQSTWVEQGMLSSIVDMHGDYCAVWAVPQYQGINFYKENLAILHLVFNIKEDYLYEDIIFNFDIRLLNDNIDITISSAITVHANAIYETSLFANKETVELYSSVEKCFFVNNDYHMIIIDDIAYIRPHTRDMYDVCVFCHKYISDIEIIIEEPLEAAIEEVE